MIRNSQELVFTQHEVAAMIRAAPCLWWKAFIELAVSTGLRTVEILRLHASDLDAKTLSVRVTSDPTGLAADPEQVTLRCSMPLHRERTVSIDAAVMRTLSRLRSERSTDSHIFVPDWKLDQLWPRIVTGEPLTSELLSPDLGKWFQMTQRRARLVLAKDAGVPVSQTRWRHRSLRALRATAIRRLAVGLPPSSLAEHLGYAAAQSVLRFYGCAVAGSAGGVA